MDTVVTVKLLRPGQSPPSTHQARVVEAKEVNHYRPFDSAGLDRQPVPALPPLDDEAFRGGCCGAAPV